ncbi:unnamed protein product [Rotaria sp. Silwood1]|nr:unnamed protein product [Rotaria sp. Silwood1]CAF1411367.1 unnamed protein product [Rotaria sp. Silwood1]CAF3586958.1 unnamed protein product [Rotaria sp. Silwood1]CAF3609319.1 unnamed protein product [Rotaria sp. Silwood1]CAF3659612.1 unnamed protein product [Rotaria sp. Silwood1]
MSSESTGVVGKWKIIDYSPHPECVDCEFKIESDEENKYRLQASVINSINCCLEHNPENDEWKSSGIASTMMGGSQEDMEKEQFVSDLITNIQCLKVEDEQHLIIQTKNCEQARFERVAV